MTNREKFEELYWEENIEAFSEDLTKDMLFKRGLIHGEYFDNEVKEKFFWWQAATESAIPEGYKVVPIEPTRDQFGGLARDIIFWIRNHPSMKQTPESLAEWLKGFGCEMPDWLINEPEMKALSHVISKGTLAAIVYKAMLADAPEVK